MHKWALWSGIALWLIGIISTQVGIIAVGSTAFIVGGVAAIVGGRSMATGITSGGSSASWTEQELAEMGPVRRFAHAVLTGGIFVALGLFGLSFAARSLRNNWLRKRTAELQRARGAETWRPKLRGEAVTLGRHGWFEALALGGDRVWFTDSGFGIVRAEMHSSSGHAPLSLGGWPVQRVRWLNGRLLWASSVSVGVIEPADRLELLGQWRANGLPRALARTNRWTAWDEGSAVIVAELEQQATRRLAVGLPQQGQIVLAGLGYRLLFGPAADCPLKSIDLDSEQQECLMPDAKRPVASDATATQVALAFENGELVSLSAAGPTRWGRLSSPLALSLVDSSLFVVTSSGVFRLRAPGASPEQLFRHQLDACEAAGAFGRLFAWQFGDELRVIRQDANPLEAFERL